MITSEDKDRIVIFKQALDKGSRVSGREVTEVYNRVFNDRKPSTNCSSCIRQRIGKLFNQLTKENKDDK